MKRPLTEATALPLFLREHQMTLEEYHAEPSLEAEFRLWLLAKRKEPTP